MVVTMGQQYDVGENPTVLLLYTTYIARHAEPPNITKQKTLQYIIGPVLSTCPLHTPTL